MTNPNLLVLYAALIGCVLAHPANATEIPHYACFEKASNHYQIDINMLLAIATVESEFDMSATNVNRNGSMDYGVMMINSHWQPKLEEMGIEWEEVTTSPCLNIHVGAWVLANNFARVGVNWYAVGAYNAGFGSSDLTRTNRRRYAAKVYQSLARIRQRFPELVAKSAIATSTATLPADTRHRNTSN